MEKLKASIICADVKTSEIINDFLVRFQYDVVSTTQYGFNCINDITKYKPDVVIGDVYNYDLDICRMYEQLKSEGKTEDILFVVMSSVTDSSLINAVLGCGIDMYTLLPTDFYSLDKSIRTRLENKRNGKKEKPETNHIEFGIRKQIHALAHELGLSNGTSGYEYLVDSIYIAVTAGKDSKLTVTKDIYVPVAQMNNTSAAAVERAMRSSIEKSWLKGNAELINEIFGYSVDAEKGRATNAQYIFAVADKIKTIMKIK